MQNKSAIWVFTILLTLVCLYELSFSWVTAGFEDKALSHADAKVDSLVQQQPDLRDFEVDSAREYYKTRYLRKNGNEEIYPIFGHTYNECKQKGLNLGLDLKGGMNVTLQVSIPDLLIELSGNSKDEDLREAIRMAKKKEKSSQKDFITLFAESFQQIAPDKKLAAVFHRRENKEMFPADATNEEVVSTLRDKSRAAIRNTERILRTRIDKFGVTQPKLQRQQFSGRIIVELPGVKDKQRVRDYLQTTASLEFWETYENEEVYSMLDRANSTLSQTLHPALDTTGSDTAEEDIEKVLEGDEASTQDKTKIEGSDQVDESEGMDTVATDTAGTDELLEELGAGKDQETEEDTGVVDQQDGSLSAEEQRKRNPLFAVLSPNLYQDQQSGTLQLAEGPVVGYSAISDTARVNRLLKHSAVQGIFPKSLRFLWGAEAADGQAVYLYAIKVTTRNGDAPLDGEVIVDAQKNVNYKGQVEVEMQMNSDGAATWKNMTGENIGRAIAIVLDDRVYSAPVVQGEIPYGRSSITMGSRDKADQHQEGKDLANLLKAGALPAPVDIVDESVVGPSLGQKNIDAGLMSFIIALVVILFYMVIYYSGAGIVSDIALIANLFFLIGALASLQAALTLPGIAGIVLTIGIAVDANVLIFDRIREELRKGKALTPAITEGYRKAYAAIIDANITTLLTGIILATFGSGPIKGFATTLIIGIFTSLFSAIFITRLIFALRLDKRKNIAFATNYTRNLFTKVNFNFLARRKLFYGVSALVIVAGIVSFGTKGFNMGVEFVGGRTYKVQFDGKAELQEIRSTLGDIFLDEKGVRMPPEVKTFGSSNRVKITTKYLINDDSEKADRKVEAQLGEGLKKIVDKYEIVGSRKVDPTISYDIKVSSFWAVILSLTAIFLYILIRFRKWQYGLGALMAMFHDVLIVLSVFSLLYGLMPFSLEIDQAFIAAILTVVGYSINDTVVVFDRIREYLREHTRKDTKEVVNLALNSTLSRTFNTSMTTFMVLLMIFLLGSETIRGFAFALMIGVVVGTYSSLFIATPAVVDLTKRLAPEKRTGKAKAVPKKKRA